MAYNHYFGRSAKKSLTTLGDPTGAPARRPLFFCEAHGRPRTIDAADSCWRSTASPPGSARPFAWLIVVLTLLISWEVFSRYVLNKPHAWVLDAQIMLYGTLFMMAGAYTLRRTATCAATCSTASSGRARRRRST